MCVSFRFPAFDLLVEVDIQPVGGALAAHQKSLLQLLQVPNVQHLGPFKEVFLYNLIQYLYCLAKGKNYLLAAVRFSQEGALLKDLERTKSKIASNQFFH